MPRREGWQATSMSLATCVNGAQWASGSDKRLRTFNKDKEIGMTWA